MSQNYERNVATIIFLIGIFLLGLDINDDLSHGSSFEHILEEAAIVAACVIGVLVLWFRFFKSKTDTLKFKQELTSVKADLEKFKKDTAHLAGDLNRKIHGQFSAWCFSEAEKDVALLALKGMTVKDIASARSTSEKTVTQQLSNIYQKSGLHGRAELSAYFLEDIFS